MASLRPVSQSLCHSNLHRLLMETSDRKSHGELVPAQQLGLPAKIQMKRLPTLMFRITLPELTCTRLSWRFHQSQRRRHKRRPVPKLLLRAQSTDFHNLCDKQTCAYGKQTLYMVVGPKEVIDNVYFKTCYPGQWRTHKADYLTC